MDRERWIVFYGEWVAFAMMALAAVAIFGCGGFLMVLLATVNAAGVRDMYRQLDAALPNPFDVSTVPTTILIDRQGVVRESYLGPRDYEFFASRVGPLL